MRWGASVLAGLVSLAIGLATAPADPAKTGAGAEDLPLAPPTYVPESDPSAEPDMDHGEKKHHHHQHLADHKGKEHKPGGLGAHHHHEHKHPHAADPHHHHPH